MSDSTAKKIVRKAITLRTIFNDVSISDAVLEEVFDKVSHEASRVRSKQLMTDRKIYLFPTRLSVFF
jgi:hypothetical protein